MHPYIMNYQRIYYELCDYCKHTDPTNRLRKRQSNDPRLSPGAPLYTEVHHIIPRHAGGNDESSNLVRMLPEEHYLAHLLRFRAYGDRSDFVAVRCIRNGVVNPNKHKIDSGILLSKCSFLKRIGLFKQHVVNFRKQHGWHTEDGLKRISESRRGMVLCIDSVTGESVGVVSNDDPNVLSGRYVHFRTGLVAVVDVVTGCKLSISIEERLTNPDRYQSCSHYGKDSSGCNNNNYKHLSSDRIKRLYKLIPLAIEDGQYLRMRTFSSLVKEEFANDFKRVGVKWIGDINDLLSQYNMEHGTDYVFNPYKRTSKQRNKLKNATAHQRWVTDGVVNKKVVLSQLPQFLIENPTFRPGKASTK